MIDARGIESVSPHRGNMRMVDEIRELTENHAIGIKHVRNDEFWCAGHFPGKPIMPGVLQIEALAQTACFLALKHLHMDNGKTLVYFTTMERIKFSHMVKPGDTLELHVDLITHKMRLYKFHGIAMVSGQKVAEATFTAVMDSGEK